MPCASGHRGRALVPLWADQLLQVLSSQQSEGRRHCLREKPGGTHLFPSHQQLSPTVSPDTGPSPTQGASRSYSHGFGGPATLSRAPRLTD